MKELNMKKPDLLPKIKEFIEYSNLILNDTSVYLNLKKFI